jgi:hypothetical protein
LESWLEQSRLWHKLSGKRSRVDAQARPLRSALADFVDGADIRQRDLTLLAAEPGLYRQPFEERQAEAESRRRVAEHELAALENRLVQLRLLDT